jgi:cytochrome b561
MAKGASRYTVVAITLHWLMALALLSMIPMGWWMADEIKAEDPARRAFAEHIFQIHKSVGFSILALSLVRLGWRFAHPVPPLPEAMPGWQKQVARGVQVLFYVIMVALPLSGWVYVSAGYSVELERALQLPTLWFGLFEIPHLPFITGQDEAARIGIAEGSMRAHSLMAWGVIVLTALHGGGALKHQFVDKDGVLGLMVPGLGPKGEIDLAPKSRAPALILGGLVIVAAVAAVLFAALRPGHSATAAATPPKAAAGCVIGGPVAPPANAAFAAAPRWEVDPAASSIRFSGVHDGRPFQGAFTGWRAFIGFDPANLDGGKAIVEIDTGCAATGDRFQESTLKQGEWFNVAAFPMARFETDRIRARDGGYDAEGALVVKGKTVPAKFDFTLSIDGAKAVMAGKLVLRRKDLDLGQISDPGADWVSEDIPVEIAVTATRVGG